MATSSALRTAWGPTESAERTRSVNIMILAVLAVLAVVAIVLLSLALAAAERIETKANNIARTGMGINQKTDTIIQLSRTNGIARSILASAAPLHGELAIVLADALAIQARAGTIDTSAGSIDNSATSINSSAGSINGLAATVESTASAIDSTASRINGTAGAVNGTAASINQSANSINATATGIGGDAGSILNVAKLIDRDANVINADLGQTVSLAHGIQSDTGNILGQAGSARTESACIAEKLDASGGGDCHGS